MFQSWVFALVGREQLNEWGIREVRKSLEPGEIPDVPLGVSAEALLGKTDDEYIAARRSRILPTAEEFVELLVDAGGDADILGVALDSFRTGRFELATTNPLSDPGGRIREIQLASGTIPEREGTFIVGNSLPDEIEIEVEELTSAQRRAYEATKRAIDANPNISPEDREVLLRAAYGDALAEIANIFWEGPGPDDTALVERRFDIEELIDETVAQDPTVQGFPERDVWGCRDQVV